MSIYFASNYIYDFKNNYPASSWYESTSSGYFDNNFAKSGIYIDTQPSGSSAPYFYKILSNEIGAASANGWWLSFYVRAVHGSMGNPFIKIFDNNNNPVIDVSTVVGNQYVFNVYSNTGSSSSFNTNFLHTTLCKIDFHCYTSSGNTILEFYVNNALSNTVNVTGDNRGLYKIQFYSLSSYFSGNGAVYSEIIVADEVTLRMRVKTLLPTSDGSQTAWNGAYTKVASLAPDGDNIYSTTSGETRTFLHGYTVPSNAEIKLVRLHGYASSYNPNGVQTVLRINNVNYIDTLSDLRLGGTFFTKQFETSPATGVAFTPEEVNTMEFGVQHS